MAFKPTKQVQSSNIPAFKYPTPKEGSRPARVSLIVDLGTQPREDIKDDTTGKMKALKPNHQVAFFADLTADVVDYGGNLGKQQYRILLNTEWERVIKGSSFVLVSSTEPGKPATFDAKSLPYKLAKATGVKEIIEDAEHAGDVELLLGKGFMAEVEIRTGSVKRDDGEYSKYPKYRGAASIPEFDIPEEELCPAMNAEPYLVTFDTEDPKILAMIKYKVVILNTLLRAPEFKGSLLEAALIKDGVDFSKCTLFETYKNNVEGVSEAVEEENTQVVEAPSSEEPPATGADVDELF